MAKLAMNGTNNDFQGYYVDVDVSVFFILIGRQQKMDVYY